MARVSIKDRSLYEVKIDDLDIRDLIKNRFKNTSVSSHSKDPKELISLAEQSGDSKFILDACKLQYKEKNDLWLTSLALYLSLEGRRSMQERSYKDAIQYFIDATKVCVLKLEYFYSHKNTKGRVTGVTEYGIFLDVNGDEGLIHISEISWDRVRDPNTYAKVGDVLDVIIIGHREGKLSLSKKRFDITKLNKQISALRYHLTNNILNLFNVIISDNIQVSSENIWYKEADKVIKKELSKEFYKKIQSYLKEDFSIYVFIAYFRASIFAEKLCLYKYSKTINSLLCKHSSFVSLKTALIFHQKRLRRHIFAKKDFLGSKSELNEIILTYELLNKVYEYLAEKETNHVANIEYRDKSLLFLADSFRYRAYLSNSVRDSKELFDTAIDLIKNNNLGKRDLFFMAARKFEYLALIEKNEKKKIAFLKTSSGEYSKIRNYKSIILDFFADFHEVILKANTSIDDSLKYSIRVIRNNKYRDIKEKEPKVIDMYDKLEILSLFSEKELSPVNRAFLQSKSDEIPLAKLCLSAHLFKEFIGTNKDKFKEIETLFKDLIKLSLREEDIGQYSNKILLIEDSLDSDSEQILRSLEEDKNLEIKGSLALDMGTYFATGQRKRNEEVKKDFLKQIVAFLNSEGGVLVIGLLESHKFKIKVPKEIEREELCGNEYIVAGIKDEFKDSIDDFQNEVRDLVVKRIDRNIFGELEFKKLKLKERVIGYIKVPRGKTWHYLDNQYFYVRENNTSPLKQGEEADRYKLEHPR